MKHSGGMKRVFWREKVMSEGWKGVVVCVAIRLRPADGLSFLPFFLTQVAHSIVPHIRPRALPSRPFPIHDSDHTITDAMQCQLLATLLCNVRNETSLKLEGCE
jgi:hypothetical protein